MLKTFKIGGVHPAENKLSVNAPIINAMLPKTVTIPIGQHIGAPAAAIVKKGDKVVVGQLIAKSNGFVSANIHSSVSGTVLKLDDIIDASGFKRPAIFIEVDGDEWDPAIDRTETIIKEITLSREQIVAKIQESGIVGLGGATFPAHVKLSPPPGKTANVLIINGVECEPYLTADHRLMLEKGEQIVIGASILMKAIGVEKAFIGIENNKPDAIKNLDAICKKYNGIKVIPLKVKYPQGGEKQLINAITGRQVPSGALPIEVGAVVHNVATANAVYEAVQKNKPLFERVVTVTGKAVNTPSNFLVRIGTPTSMLIEAAGGMPQNTGKIVSGGPMMGKALSNTDAPIAKGSSGVLLFDQTEAQRRRIDPCIRCGKCVSVCAMGLEPYLLMNYSERAMWDDCEINKIMDCIECGSCMYTCPANRPLLDYIRLAKATVGKNIRARKQ